MADDLNRAARGLEDKMIAWRRDFHQHPEIGLQEERSAGIVAEHLRSLGLQVRTGVGRTGVVGLLEGGRPGKTLMLRADMDALPIQEQNDVPYRSQNDGFMHACAHDGHMAIMMGVAEILAGRRDRISGRIKFVFQPGEEGFGGAGLMIEDGVLENPKVDAAMGLHIWSGTPVGTIGVGEGPVMASADAFSIRILGESGHGAHPETAVDAILISGHVITSIQSLVSREVSAQTPLVVHIGMIRGGTAGNIVADRVTLRASTRALDEKLRQSIPERLDRLVGGIASAFGGRHEIRYIGGIGPVVNDAAVTTIVRDAAAVTVGPDNVILPEPSMGSEDMAMFLEKVPGCFFFIGARNADQGFDRAHHHPLFDFDEAALTIGAETLARAALNFLGAE